MRWRRFLVANAAAGILRAAICISVGYLAGHTLERLPLTIDPVIGGAAVLVIVVAIMLLRRRMVELAKRAEDAYPGPLE